MKDHLTEFGYGEGAVTLQGRFAFANSGTTKGSPLHRTMMVGVVITPEPFLESGWWDMWDAEIILIPKKKFNAELGWEAGAILTEGLAQQEIWGEPYWEAPDKEGE